MVNAFDTEITRYFSDLVAPNWLDPFMLIWTDYSLYVYIALCVVFLFFKKTRINGVYGLLAFVLSMFLVDCVWKNIFERVRPYDQFDWVTLIGNPTNSFSFPSGHSSLAFAIATALAYKNHLAIKLMLFISASITAFSRIYLSIHYTTDVLAGIVHGILCGLLAIVIVMGVKSMLVQSKKKNHK